MFALTDDDGALNGPFNAMLLSPRLGDLLQSLGAGVRYQTSLSDRIREIAILAVATYWHSDFERYAHEAVGRASGVTEDELTALRDLPKLQLDEPHETAALDVTRALLQRQDLSDAEYAAARMQLTESELFEITTLVSYYAGLALLMRVFRVGAPG